MKTRLIFCMALCCLQFGCGSTEGQLSTSAVKVSVDKLIMDSDVITWTDAATCTGPSTPAADSVNVTVASTAYANTGSAGLPVRVERVTINYTPANSSTPAMASEYQTINALVANGGSLILPVRVATQEQKERLQQALGCGGPIYKYYTDILLEVSEIGTDKSRTVSVSMDLRFADFVD